VSAGRFFVYSLTHFFFLLSSSPDTFFSLIACSMGVSVFLGLLLVRLIPGMSLSSFLQEQFSRHVYHFFDLSGCKCLFVFLYNDSTTTWL
jgi:hypothetical protein